MKKRQRSRVLLQRQLELIGKQMDSLFVNGEAGDRAVGAAGGRSQYFPAGRKMVYRPSAEQIHTSVWHEKKESVQ